MLTPAEMSTSARRVLRFIDLGGHEKYLKTALYGMTCMVCPSRKITPRHFCVACPCIVWPELSAIPSRFAASCVKGSICSVTQLAWYVLSRMDMGSLQVLHSFAISCLKDLLYSRQLLLLWHAALQLLQLQQGVPHTMSNPFAVVSTPAVC